MQPTEPTQTGKAKAPAGATRREQILKEAARLFAERGFHGVGVDEIGAAVGISGPGLYRHFAGKDAMLAELLVGISGQLLTGAKRRLAEADRLARSNDPALIPQIQILLDSAQEDIGVALLLADELQGEEAIDLLAELSGVVARQRTLLEGLLPGVPVAQQPSIQRALTDAQQNEAVVEQALRSRVEERLPPPLPTAAASPAA